MGPIGHSAISAGIGVGVWGITDSPASGGAALAVGVLTDVDHLFDYYLWYIRRKKNRIFLFFHAWEYGIIGILVLGFFFYHPLLMAAVAAHLGHVTTDHLHNRIAPWGYSMTYRLFVKFDRRRITPNHNVLRSYQSWLHMLPFGSRLEPWYQRKIEPWFQSRLSD